MRIVLAVNNLAMGGAERNVVNFGVALRSRGHEVSVVAGRGSLAGALSTAELTHIVSGSYLRRPWTVARTAWQIDRLHRRSAIDVVHAFMASTAVAAGLARRIGRTRGAPTFGILSAPPSSTQDPEEPRWITKLRLRLIGAPSDVVLAPSAALQVALMRAGTPRDRIKLAEFNTIPVEHFNTLPDPAALYEELSLRREDPVVCSIARLHPLKGQDLLLRAAPRVLGRAPAVRFVLVGDGPARADLQRLARDLGIQHAVRFAGERSDVRPFLALATVVVQTTRAISSELGLGGPGLSVLEAWAARRPVVGFDFPDLRDAVGRTRAALLTPQDDTRELADSILTVVGNPQLAREVAADGNRLVHERFDLARFAEALEAFYREACDLAKGQSGTTRTS